MKLSELLERFRSDADDKVTPYLWSDADVKFWLNEAEQEACRRSVLLKDSSTTEICRVTAGTSNPWIKLDPRIVRVLRAKPTSQTYPVGLLSSNHMDNTVPNWESATGTELNSLITDLETGKLRTFPIMTADVAVELTVQRLPLKDMSELSHCPEIRKESHVKLVHWALFKAYSVPDIDANDPKKAVEQMALFEAEFGKPVSAAHDEWLRQHGGRDLFTGDFVL